MNRKQFLEYAKTLDISANNTLGARVTRYRTDFKVGADERFCESCPSGARANKSDIVAVCLAPKVSTYPEIKVTGVSVRLHGMCSHCVDKFEINPLPEGAKKMEIKAMRADEIKPGMTVYMPVINLINVTVDAVSTTGEGRILIMGPGFAWDTPANRIVCTIVDAPGKEGEKDKLSEKSWNLFTALCADSSNWGHVIPSDGNVVIDNRTRGNLTDLKRKGLVVTQKDGGKTWIMFTEKGKQWAADLSYTVEATAPTSQTGLTRDQVAAGLASVELEKTDA